MIKNSTTLFRKKESTKKNKNKFKSYKIKNNNSIEKDKEFYPHAV
jgi:hypothetical protein